MLCSIWACVLPNFTTTTIPRVAQFLHTGLLHTGLLHRTLPALASRPAVSPCTWAPASAVLPPPPRQQHGLTLPLCSARPSPPVGCFSGPQVNFLGFAFPLTIFTTQHTIYFFLFLLSSLSP